MRVWKVYSASSWALRGSRYRDGLAALIIERGRGGGALREAISDGKGARSWICLAVRVERGREGSGYGGLRRPTFGVIRNFW